MVFKKTSFKLFQITCLAFLQLLSFKGLCQTQIEVIAKGYFPSSKNLPESELKSLALKDAYFRAVEQGVGLFVNHTTSVKNFSDIVSVSFTKSMGYIKSYQEISCGIENDNYFVLIKAIVEKGSFFDKNAISAYRLFNQIVMNNPSIKIIVNTDEYILFSRESLKSTMISLLQDYGFQIFDFNQTLDPEKEEEDLTLELDIVTGGINRVKELKDVSDIISQSMTYSLRLRMNDTNKILYSISKQISGVGIDQERAQYHSLLKFVEMIKNDMIENLPKNLSEIPKEVSITFNNVSETQIESIDQILKSIKDIYTIELVNWNRDSNKLKYKILTNPISGETKKIWFIIEHNFKQRLILDNLTKNFIVITFNN